MRRKLEICENCNQFYSFATCRKTVCRLAGGEMANPVLRDINIPFESRKVPEKCVFLAEQMMANFNSGEKNGHR